MSQIEELYHTWQESGPDPDELHRLYSKAAELLNKSVKKEMAAEIDSLYTDCVGIESLEAFKAGFRQAMLLWKECLQ